MPWRGPEYPGEFPTLGYQVAQLIQECCAIPDGDLAGSPFLLTDEMIRFLLWHYRIDPDTGRFYFGRGSQLVRPQKWGKGPFFASIVCGECHPEGPVIPDGWDANGDPVGRPWSTPWWQITGSSEDQAANVWRALVPMIERGALSADIPDTGMTRINLPGGGLIEPVTSSARSRLGQRITGAVQDETHDWTKLNGGRKLADTQRRNLAGMGGRFLESSNAWDPADRSVAQQTSESGEPGVYRDDVEPGTGSIRNRAHRQRMLRRVYGDSWWVDLERIDTEIVALLQRDAAQAERYFLNRKRAAEGAAFDPDRWAQLAAPAQVPEPGALITIGVDGARFADALGIVAVEIPTGFVWPLGIWERPEDAADEYEHPPEEIDGVMLEAFETYEVWRLYGDEQWIEHLMHRWRGRWGKDRVVAWYTNRPKQTAHAVRRLTTGITGGDLSHNGDEKLARHVANARKQKVNVYDEEHRQMYVLSKDRPDSPRKIDGAMGLVLGWEARGDAIAAGATKPRGRTAAFL